MSNHHQAVPAIESYPSDTYEFDLDNLEYFDLSDDVDLPPNPEVSILLIKNFVPSLGFSHSNKIFHSVFLSCLVGTHLKKVFCLHTQQSFQKKLYQALRSS